jgi:hypothetical protein
MLLSRLFSPVGRRLLAVAGVLAVLIPASAAIAHAAKPAAYKLGTYRGTTAQQDPRTQAPLKISFKVTRGKIKSVKFTILERCADGGRLLVTEPISGPIKIKSNGSFGYLARYTDGSHALFTGHIKGHKAKGNVAADGDHNSAGASCSHTANVKWSAKR